MQVQEVRPAQEGAGHRIVLAHADVVPSIDLHDGHQAYVHRPDRGCVVVEQADKARAPGDRQNDLLGQFPAQGVLDHVAPQARVRRGLQAILRVHVAAHPHRPQTMEPLLAPAAGAPEDEELVAAHDQRVGDDLLQRGVLLDPGAIGEVTRFTDQRQPGVGAGQEPVRGSVAEEHATRHHVDLFAAVTIAVHGSIRSR